MHNHKEQIEMEEECESIEEDNNQFQKYPKK